MSSKPRSSKCSARLVFSPKELSPDRRGDRWFNLAGWQDVLVRGQVDVRSPSSLESLPVKGKVEGKLTGTVGLFFSMSGYSTDAVQALLVGKDLNLVLFDDSDINFVVDERIDIADAIRFKVRAAAESGTPPYLQLDKVLAAASQGEIARPRPRIVFVEGRFEERVFEYLRDDRNATEPVQLMNTAGPMNMARTIDAMLQLAGHPLPFVAVLEQDEAERKSGRDVQEIVDQVNAENGQAELLWIPSSLDERLGLTERDRQLICRLPPDRLAKFLAQVDLDEQISLHPELVPVLTAVGIPIRRP